MTIDENPYTLWEYIKNFNIHYELLLRRYKRLKEIDTSPIMNLDVLTYMDMIIVQLRAICIENEKNKNNYTAQILLRKLGEYESADKIDDMLKEEFYDGSIKIDVRTALKILSDEFICHYDNFDNEKKHRLTLSDIFITNLRSPYKNINLDYIMNTIISCINEGFLINDIE